MQIAIAFNEMFFGDSFMKPIQKRSDCPVSSGLDVFGDKWTLLILRDMMFFGKTSFSEFLCSSEKIASNILTDRLNLLHQEGFVTKHPAPENKSKYLYTLTDKAIDLVPVITEISLWGIQHTNAKDVMQIAEKMKKNKTRAIKEIQDQLRAAANQ